MEHFDSQRKTAKGVWRLFVLAMLVGTLLVGCTLGSDQEKKGLDSEVESETTIKNVLVYVDYDKSSFSYNDTAILYIDDTAVGKIKAGQSEEFSTILIGNSHEAQVKSDTTLRHNNSSILRFELEESQSEIHFTVEDNSWLGLTINLK